MSADAERFCERQNRQPILIGFVSDICRLMLRGFVKDKTTIQIGFVSDICRLMLRGFVKDKIDGRFK